MNQKTLIWIGILVGSTVGGYIPTLWGAGLLSMSSIILSTAGGIAGIWLGFRMSQLF